MKLKFRYFLASAIIAVIFITGLRKYIVPSEIHPQRTPANRQKPQPLKRKNLDIRQIDQSRIPRAKNKDVVLAPIKNLVFSKDRKPSSTNAPLDPKEYRGMFGLSYVPELRALKSIYYSAEMGEIQGETRGMTYFSPNPGRSDENWANVVYNKANNQYFPLSSVLKVQNINPESRDALNSLGYQEYYYSSVTRILYLTSSHSNLFRDYQNLDSQGYKVSLEVLKGEHRSR